MEQFNIFNIPFIPLFNITNLNLLLFLSLTTLILFFLLINTRLTIVPNRFQLCFEILYNNCLSIVEDNIGEKGRPLVPFIFTLYIFLIFLNLISLVPYSFSITAHISISFALSLSIWFAVLFSALYTFQFNFFSLFMPSGVPILLAPLIILIEFISFLSRAISLAVRLAANLTAGHVLLAIISMFSLMLGVLGIFPAFLVVILLVLETAVALIQSFVFVLLTCIYMKDSYHLH